MITAPLPALAVVAPAAPPAPAAGAAPATPGAFAQELHQAKAGTPADTGAPEARPAAPAEDASADRPQAPADEAPVNKSLRQWLQQTAAARRAAHKPVHDVASMKAGSTHDAARDEALDPTSPRRHGPRKDDIDSTSLAAVTGMTGTTPVRIDMETDSGARPTAALAADPSAETVAPDASAQVMPAVAPPAGPAVAAPVTLAVATGLPAGPVASDVALPDAPVDHADPAVAGAADVDLPETGSEGRDAPRAAQPGNAPASPNAESATDPVRGGPASSKGQREHVTDTAPRAEERETFAAALNRQTEGTAIVVPPPPPAAGGAPRNDLAPAAARPPVDVPVPTDFNSPQWAQSVGNQLSLLATDGVQNARLHLHPAEMGPISVQIVIDGQTAQVHLGVDNAETRQALEQAMPNLAASLRESGLTLTGGGVFEQPRQSADQAPDGRPGTARPSERDGRGDPADPAAAVTTPPRAIRRQGVVDMYA